MKEKQDKQQERMASIDGVEVDICGDITDEAARKWLEDVEKMEDNDEKKG